MSAAVSRAKPCASCPYRRNVPSGVWHPDDYAKLPAYDRDTMDQPANAFMCHQGDGCVCSGWLAHRGPYDLLAVRIGVMRGNLDASCMDHETDVPLFESGQAAADHGMRDIENPGAKADAVMGKITRLHEARP